MRFISLIAMLGALAIALPEHGQNTAGSSTPQTNSAAPAATSRAARNAQAAEASATRSSAQHGSRSAAGKTRTAPAGITGVPRYRAGFRRANSPPAKAATASVTVTGIDDGSLGERAEQQTQLPGIPQFHNAFGIAKGTPIQVTLNQPVDSGHAKNGDMIHGVLAAPIAGLPAGAPVQLTVVAVAAAGQMTSNGELSMQVVSIDGQRVLSDVITAEGKEGRSLLPDSAPARGTEAIFPADQPITLPAG